jgi:hypothetical protein
MGLRFARSYRCFYRVSLVDTYATDSNARSSTNVTIIAAALVIGN